MRLFNGFAGVDGPREMTKTQHVWYQAAIHDEHEREEKARKRAERQAQQ